MFISQIFITDTRDSYPPYIQHCIDSIHMLYPDAHHHIYDERKLVDFIECHFDKRVITAYKKLIPNAYKADLGRYCLLYKLGGWYFDIAVKPIFHIDFPENIDLCVFRDIGLISTTSHAVSNGIIYTKPDNPIFKAAIESVIENCRLHFYGVNALSPTGPNLFGEAIASKGTNSRNIFGDVMYLTPLHSNKNKSFVLPNGEIFAFFKPSDGGDLSSLGVIGGNNYVTLYQEGKIYRD